MKIWLKIEKYHPVKKAVDAGYVPCKIFRPPYYK
jgi:hypothetical protein